MCVLLDSGRLKKTLSGFVFILLVSCSLRIVAQERVRMDVEVDPAFEARFKKLSSELRCLVCQNETLADSRADLAIDLRNEILQQMKAGKTDQEIIAFLTARYGDFVLYRPPLKPTTYLLWFGPFALLILGFLFLYRYLRERAGLISDQPLTEEEHQRAEKLLHPDTRKEVA